MKKKPNDGEVMPFLQKIKLIMRITLILLIISSSLAFSSNSYSQKTKLSFNLNNVTMKEALRTIESNSEFIFFYQDQQIDLNRRVSVSAYDRNIQEVLDQMFEGTDNVYVVRDRQIIIGKSEKELETKNAQVARVLDEISQQPAKKEMKGIVTDEKGQPLPGVSVVVPGTTTGIVTDIDGNFTLNVPADTKTLLFSFVGMKSQQIAITGKNSINVKMAEDAVGVEDVVVIGYGTRSKKDVTTAISSVGSEKIAKSIAMSPEMAMQGQMTGVQVLGTTGNPMARPTIRIRGVNTWGVAEPLYVIDGIPVTEFGAGIEGQEDARAADVRGPLNIMSLIDPNDIESISVLKDASAAAIYGVRAANGVILITTKKGRGDKPVVELSSRVGIQNIYQKLDYLNTQQYTKRLQDLYAGAPNVTISPENRDVLDPTSPKYLGNSPTYDWQNAIRNKNAPTQDYSARVSGGTNRTDYYASMSYSDTKGTMKGNELTRYSGSFKMNTQINDWLKFGLNYRLTYGKGVDYGITLNDAKAPAWQPIYDENGPYGYAPTVAGLLDKTDYNSYSNTKLWGEGTRINVLGLMASKDNYYKSLRNMGNAYIEIEPIKNLKIKGQLSIDKYDNERYEFSDHDGAVFNYTAGNPYTLAEGKSVGSYGERFVYNYNQIWEVTVNYNKSFNLHNFDFLLNWMDQEYNSKYTGMSTDYMTSKLPYLRKLGGENKYTNVGSDIGRWALQGYLGRIAYNYDYKYYLDVVLRRDGSARFAPENRWGYFPAISAAWRIKKEHFMDELTWLDDLKLRAGWGQLGNQEVRDMAYLSPINTKPTFSWGAGGTRPGTGDFYTGATVFGIPNRALTWEKSETFNIGLDATIFQNLTLSAEYYNKNTKGILQTVSLPGSVGVVEQPVANIASVNNRGFEFSVNYTNKIGDLTYSVGGNLTTVRNRVTKTYEHIPVGTIEEGYSINYYKAYKVAGMFETQDEINQWLSKYSDDSYKTSLIRPGDLYFHDLRSAPKEAGQFYSTEKDDKVSNYDMVYVGKSIPGFYYGLNVNLEYKGIDLGAQFTGVGDVVKYNGILAAEIYPQTKDNVTTKIFNEWSASNPNGNIPRLNLEDPAANMRYSDFFFESAAYFRLANLQLGYTLPKSFYDSVGNSISNARIYLGASNLFTITPYSGIDPENDGYPMPRTFFMGLNIRF